MYDKFELYEASVQYPEGDIEFLEKTYRSLRGRKPRTLREDFCGTAKLACTWVEQNPDHQAWAIDLDLQPLHYGLKKHYAKLSPEAKKRVRYVEANVLRAHRVRADIIAALNFSYFIFKDRKLLRDYFASACESLNKGGMLVIDLFGGSLSQTVIEEKTEHRNWTYHWDCKEFNPINSHCKFAIHFTLKKGKKFARKQYLPNAFRYDWRLWTVAELREILAEAGFKRSVVYWEGDDGKGGGNGVFRPKEREENSESWIAYIAALK